MSIKIVGGKLSWKILKHSCMINSNIESGPVIFASLHRDMIASLMYLSGSDTSLLISNSNDGDILESVLSVENFNFIRGSSGNDGSVAYKRLVTELANGKSVGLAVDGPQGPHGHIQEGVIAISILTGCPIVPLTIDYSLKLSLNNWDETAVPVPFSRIKVTAHDKIYCVEKSSDYEKLSILLGGVSR
jgi:lysophospholipid acyltransferase (LPLAT)-like uncharacterized protein